MKSAIKSLFDYHSLFRYLCSERALIGQNDSCLQEQFTEKDIKKQKKKKKESSKEGTNSKENMNDNSQNTKQEL